MRKIIYIIEAILLFSIAGIIRLIPIDIASAIGGFLARTFGPLLKEHKLAHDNLRQALPGLSDAEYNAIVRGMWNNLGRVVFEYPFIFSMKMQSRIHFINEEMAQKFANSKQQVIFVSGHFANWELIGLMSSYYGIDLTVVYRHINNPYIDAILGRLRRPFYKTMIPKSSAAALKMMRAVKDGDSIAMLIDQKIFRGLILPFMERPATTVQMPAELALKYKLPIAPVRVRRTKGVNFEVTVDEPFYAEDTGDKEKDIYNTMLKLNQTLESWIKDDPKQWFWVHNRWKIHTEARAPKIKKTVWTKLKQMLSSSSEHPPQ